MLRHPYLRALAAFFAAWLCIGGVCGLAFGVAFAGKAATPGVQFFAIIGIGVLGTLGLMAAVAGAACMAYGTVRSLQRGEAGPANRTPAAIEQSARPMRAAPAAVETAPIPLDAAPRSVRLVMRDPTGKVVKFGMRDGSPERQAKYIAKYEADGYKFLRTEDLDG